MEYLPFLWLGVAVLAAIVEAVVPALVSIWFVPGGLAALIVSLCGGSFLWQMLVFFAVSAVAVAITRPLAKKVVRKDGTPTNADRVIGAEGIVTQEINELLGTGQVTVRGAIWTARAMQAGSIAAGETVVVERIEGVKLIVRRK